MKTSEAARLIGRSRNWLLEMAKEGLVPHRWQELPSGRRIYFWQEAELDLYISGARLIPCDNGVTVERHAEQIGEVP